MAKHRSLDANSMLALALAALIVFTIANAYPIVAISIKGNTVSSALWGAIIATYNDGKWGVSLAVAASIFFAPLIRLLILIYILLPLQRCYRVPGLRRAMSALRWLQPWSMIDVFLLGALVAVVKIGSLATIVPGVGIYAFGLLTVLIAALNSVSHHELWNIIDEALV